MKTAAFATLGPNLIEATWNEQASKVYCLWMDNLYNANIVISQPETSDFEAAETAFNNLSDDVQAWFDDAIAASMAGEEIPALDANYMPEIIEFIGLIITGNWGGVFLLFVKVGMKALLDWLSRRLDPDNDVDDTPQVLRDNLQTLQGALDAVGNAIEANYMYNSVDHTASRGFF
jgi:hypothetical protein